MPPIEVEDRQAADTGTDDAAALVDAAFAAGFAREDGTQPLVAPVDEAPAAPAAPADPAASPAAPAPADAPAGADDDLASLPPAVRARLAKLDTLEHDFSTQRGRYNALQRELAEVRKALPPAPPPPPPPEPPRRAKLREDLPEVADALAEAVAEARDLLGRADATANAPAPSSSPADTTDTDSRTPDEIALEEVHPNWVNDLGGNEFAMYLARQKPEYAQKIRSTSSATVIADALTRFNFDREASARAQREATATQTARANRVAAAASAPVGRGARPPPGPATIDEETAFVQGFTNAR